MEQLLEYEVNLTRIEGCGDFPCPKCGITISPDDETDELYSILKTKERNKMLEVIIQCNKCATKIQLTGLSVLSIE